MAKRKQTWERAARKRKAARRLKTAHGRAEGAAPEQVEKDEPAARPQRKKAGRAEA